MTPDPLPPLGAEPGGPKFLGQPKKSSTSGFRGRNFCHRKLLTDEPKSFSGPFPGWRMGFCPHTPKTSFIYGTFSGISGIAIWKKIKQLHSSHIGSPPLSFWLTTFFTVFSNGVLKIFWWGTFWGYLHFTHLWGPDPKLYYRLLQSLGP